MKKRTLTLVLSLVLVALVAVGGTLAWLTDKTDTVTNTFSTSDIEITLDESDDLNLQMVPGHTITKDPVVTVVAGSEAAMVFVKIDKSENYGTYFEEYEVAEGWTALPDVDGVYYREVAASDADQEFAVLKDNEVTVSGDVTKTDMENIDNEQVSAPTLSFTAYATQLYKEAGVEFTAAEAWANVQSEIN